MSEIINKYFFLPPDIRTEFSAQAVNTKTGLIYACLIDNMIVFPLFDLFPVEGVQFYTSLPEKWIKKISSQTIPKDTWLNKWKKVEGCYFDEGESSNLILFYENFSTIYSFSLPINSSKCSFSAYTTPFSLNFSTEGELKEFEQDVLFVTYLTRCLSFLQKNQYNFKIEVAYGEFENLYNFILKQLKEKKYAYSFDILKNNILFVKDEEMKQRVEFFLKLALPTNQTVFYREEPLEEEINGYHIEKKKTIDLQTKRKVIKTYINTTDFIQFLKYGEQIFIVKKFDTLNNLKEWIDTHDEGINIEKIYTINEFIEQKLEKGIIYLREKSPFLYFLIKKIRYKK